MNQGFIHFHAAGRHQRHLMIAVECLLQQIEDQKNGAGPECEGPSEALLEQIVHLSQAMTEDMEKFTWALLRQTECSLSHRQFQEIEGPCNELLGAHLCVVDTARAVVSQYRHAPWIARALANVSARTKMIHAQLCEYVEVTAGSNPLVNGTGYRRAS